VAFHLQNIRVLLTDIKHIEMSVLTVEGKECAIRTPFTASCLGRYFGVHDIGLLVLDIPHTDGVVV